MKGTNMKDDVKHPSHYGPIYQVKPFECQMIRQFLPAHLSDAFKYIWRAGRKGDRAAALKDCDKALEYLGFRGNFPIFISQEVAQEGIIRAVWAMIVPPDDSFSEIDRRRYETLGAIAFDVCMAHKIVADFRKFLEENLVDSGVTENGVRVEGVRVTLGDVDYIKQKDATLGDVYIAVGFYGKENPDAEN